MIKFNKDKVLLLHRITVVIRTRPKALSYSAFGGVRP